MSCLCEEERLHTWGGCYGDSGLIIQCTCSFSFPPSVLTIVGLLIANLGVPIAWHSGGRHGGLEIIGF